MPVTVCTGLWGPAAATYRDAFLSSMRVHLPADIKVAVVADGPVQHPIFKERGVYSPLGQSGWTSFMERHRGDEAKNGRQEPGPQRWKDKERAAGYSFRFDACRFAGQAFVPELIASHLLDGEVLVWLDADVVAFKDVPHGFFEGLLGEDDGAYLGRAPKHSEIGFWAVRLGEETRAFIKTFADLYRSDELFLLKEWHSAFAWDHCRRACEDSGGLRMRNLTPGGSGHVWFQSPLGRYLDHLKGKRKAAGRSKERRG